MPFLYFLILHVIIAYLSSRLIDVVQINQMGNKLLTGDLVRASRKTRNKKITYNTNFLAGNMPTQT